MSTSLILRDDGALTHSMGPSFSEAREVALNTAAMIGVVKDADTNTKAFEAWRGIKALIAEVEKSRVAAKEPFLEAGRQIDALAKSAVVELKSEEVRVNTLIGNYQQEVQAAARRAEQARQEELRKIEAERLAREEEARREAARAEAARQAELRRIEEEQAKANSAKQRLEFEAAKARIEAQRKADEAAREAEAQRQRELAAQAAMSLAPAKVAPKADGQRVIQVWDFEVTDVWMLARLHPGLVTITPNRAEILRTLAAGARDIKGIRCFEVTKSSGRVAGNKVMDV